MNKYVCISPISFVVGFICGLFIYIVLIFLHIDSLFDLFFFLSFLSFFFLSFFFFFFFFLFITLFCSVLFCFDLLL